MGLRSVLGAAKNAVKGAVKGIKDGFTNAIENRYQQLMSNQIRRSFDESKGPDGKPWKPLKYRVGKPLVLSGLLKAEARAAVKQKVDRREHDEQQKDQPSKEIVLLMDEPFYGKFHQHGTKVIPARPFFGIAPDTINRLTRLEQLFVTHDYKLLVE